MTEETSAAAAALGRVKTPRKAAAGRANLQKARAAKPVKPCTCGQPDGSHRYDCPGYRRDAVARYRAKRAAEPPA